MMAVAACPSAVASSCDLLVLPRGAALMGICGGDDDVLLWPAASAAGALLSGWRWWAPRRPVIPWSCWGSDVTDCGCRGGGCLSAGGGGALRSPSVTGRSCIDVDLWRQQ